MGDTRITSRESWTPSSSIDPSLRGVVDTEAISFFHGDHLGSTSDITDATGNLKQHTEYLPYGEIYLQQDSQGNTLPETYTEFLFTSQRLDSSTGLYYYGARYYDPEIGRFTQPDSIVPEPGNPQSFNRYSYCDNNPINYTDPTGHGKLREWLGQIIGAAMAVVTLVVTGGNIPLAMAAYAFTSGFVSSIQSGYNVAEAYGIGVITGSAGYLGGSIGSALGGGAGTFGGSLLGGGLGGASGGATYAALTGGDIGSSALAGAAGGAIAGVGGFMGGIFAPAGVLAGGGVASEIMGGEFSQGVARSIVAAAGAAVATGNFQYAQDVGQNKMGAEDRSYVSAEEIKVHLIDAYNKSQKNVQRNTFTIMLAESKYSDEQVAEFIFGVIKTFIPGGPVTSLAVEAATMGVKFGPPTPQSFGGSDVVIPYNPKEDTWNRRLEQEIQRKRIIEQNRGRA